MFCCSRRSVAVLILVAGVAIAAGPATTQTTTAGGHAPAVVVCFGDSITAKGYPAELAKKLGVRVVNAGVPGQSSVAAMGRLRKDVVDRKPDAVVILFGTNDSRWDDAKVKVPVDAYATNLAKMIDASRTAGAKVVVICTIPPIDEEKYFTRHRREPFEAAGGLGKVLEQYRAAARRVAEEKQAKVVDLAESLAKSPEWLSDDGVHPTEKGNEIIAQKVADVVGPELNSR